MEKIIKIFLVVFATYRLSSLISSEEGPFSIFEKLRMRLGAYNYGPDGKADSNLGRGVSCPFCVGVYISAVLLPFVFLSNKVGDIFLTWLGVAGAQVFLENLTSDDAIQEAIEDVAESI